MNRRLLQALPPRALSNSTSWATFFDTSPPIHSQCRTRLRSQVLPTPTQTSPESDIPPPSLPHSLPPQRQPLSPPTGATGETTTIPHPIRHLPHSPTLLRRGPNSQRELEPELQGQKKTQKKQRIRQHKEIGPEAETMATVYTTTVTKTADALPAPPDTAERKHHLRDKNGKFIKFQNPHPSYRPVDPWQGVKELLIPQLLGKVTWPDTTPPTVAISTPTFPPRPSPSLSTTDQAQPLRATWLGHACFHVIFPSGLSVLFDPVFEPRCSPVSFMGPKRYNPPPCNLSDIPYADLIVISHSHYDHLSHPSIKKLAELHPRAHFFVGLGLKNWFQGIGVGGGRVTELDWWEGCDIRLTPEGNVKTASSSSSEGNVSGESGAAGGGINASISALPSQHTSARHLLDKDTTLWCSYSISSGGKSVFFAGDTGYRAVPHSLPATTDDYGPEFAALPRTPQFKEIGEHRGPFDLGLIPIGAYEPRGFMSPMHANPYDAVEIFVDTGCKEALGIHWGTWVLTFEEVMAPPKVLGEAMAKKGLDAERFGVMGIGESREY